MTSDRVVKIAMFSAGFLLLAMAAYFSMRTVGFLHSSASAPGIVVRNAPELDPRDGHVLSYFPVFSFKTKDGKPLLIRSHTSSYPAAFQPGDAVTVLYDASDPTNARIRSLMQMWTTPLLLTLMSALIFGMWGLWLLLSRLLFRLRPNAV